MCPHTSRTLAALRRAATLLLLVALLVVTLTAALVVAFFVIVVAVELLRLIGLGWAESVFYASMALLTFGLFVAIVLAPYLLRRIRSRIAKGV